MADLYTTVEPINILAGDTFSVPFSFYDNDKTPLDLMGLEVEFLMSPVNIEDPILIKQCPINFNEAVVNLTTNDTSNLPVGSYSFMVSIINPAGDRYNKVLGTINIVESNLKIR